MSHNGKDTSGNALKYSLIPLLLGVVVIFFLYRGCDDMVHEPQPRTTTSSQIIETEELVLEEEPVVEQEANDTVIENDTLQTEE